MNVLLVTSCFSLCAVYMCKLSETEHPLYLRLVAGPKTDVLSFVLREHETGEVLVSWICVAPKCQGFRRQDRTNMSRYLEGIWLLIHEAGNLQLPVHLLWLLSWRKDCGR